APERLRFGGEFDPVIAQAVRVRPGRRASVGPVQSCRGMANGAATAASTPTAPPAASRRAAPGSGTRATARSAFRRRCARVLVTRVGKADADSSRIHEDRVRAALGAAYPDGVPHRLQTI